ncbi:MAG: copper chaperone PCu(A)C [Rhodobacteraceae bacterium]|nr:copper chaperone PCu(A)C [Paracoccaceae bacterium]
MRSQWKIAGFALAGVFAIVAAVAYQPESRDILLGDATARAMTIGDHTALLVTLTIDNRGGPDHLLAGGSPEAKGAMLQGAQSGDGLPLPAKGAASLAADGAHLMLFELEGEPLPGRLVPITLTFQDAGQVRAKAKISASMSGASPHAAHGVAMRQVTGDQEPSVSIEVVSEGEGWRVTSEVVNFRFAPEQMDGPHKDGEGHGHLYLNGLKLRRMTSAEALIGRLPPGEHVVRLSLNTNDHAAYVVGGRPVAAEAVITVAEP